MPLRSVMIAAVILAASVAVAGDGEVATLTVGSSWEGLAGPILPGEKQQRRSWRVDCSHAGCAGPDGPIDRTLMEHLLEVLRQPAVEQLSLEDLGVTRELLLELGESCRAPSREDEERHPTLRLLSNLTTEKRDHVMARLTDIQWVEAYFRSYYRSVWTDDYPSAGGTLTLTDGTTVAFHSSAQHEFMVPWTVRTGDGQQIRTWNPEIGRAFGAILPRDFGEWSRISGTYLADNLIGEAIHGAHTVCNAITLSRQERAAVKR